MKRLTDSELQVMDLLWESNKPLTTREIVAGCKDKTWQDSYIHILIRSLEKKDMIEVAGFEKTVKNYARTFKPILSRERYAVKSLPESVDRRKLLFRVADLIATDEEMIDIMLMAVKERRAMLTDECPS